MFKRKKNKEEIIEEKIEELVEVIEESPDYLLEHLAKVNSLLKYVTELDYIKDMLIGVSRQAEMIESVAASSQEMTASIEDISHFVQDSSAKTHESIDIASQSLEDIELAIKDVVKSFEASKKVQETMDRVNNEAKKITDMVSIIKGVADQTNLLALNASIEAARAGEQGRGFAVVADEIRKLAENTNQQVEYINETFNALTNEINNTTNALHESNEFFKVGNQKMLGATESLGSMHGDLKEINGAFLEISASIEEQTAASQEMSSSIMIINDETKTLNKEITKTGRAINSISNIVNDIRLEMIAETEDIDIGTQIEICMCDHLMWRWRVYNMILGNETLNESQVGTHHTCRLGKWVDNTNIEDQNILKVIKDLSNPHSDLHNIAKKAISAYNSGHQHQAETYLKDIDHASANVIKSLKQIKKLYRKSLKQ